MDKGLAPHLPEMPTLMLSLRSTEGIVPQNDSSSSFLPFGDENEEELMAEDEEEEEGDSEISGCNVEKAFYEIALGAISVNASVVLLPYMESVFEEVFRVLE